MLTGPWFLRARLEPRDRGYPFDDPEPEEEEDNRCRCPGVSWSADKGPCGKSYGSRRVTHRNWSKRRVGRVILPRSEGTRGRRRTLVLFDLAFTEKGEDEDVTLVSRGGDLWAESANSSPVDPRWRLYPFDTLLADGVHEWSIVRLNSVCLCGRVPRAVRYVVVISGYVRGN